MSDIADLVNRDFDEPMDDDEPEPREDYRCSCPFCFCMCRTTDGGVCDSCYQGAHQG